MKQFLLSVFVILAAYLLMPFYTAAVTAFIWVPIIFQGNLFGFILGVAITIVAEVLRHKFLENNN